MFLAWHAAAFERQKRLPELEKVLAPFDGSATKQLTPEQLLAKVKVIHMQIGGAPKRKG